MNFKEKYLTYESAKVPEQCKLKISPSSFGTFISRPWQWYRQQILKLDEFKYSTSSVIGTIVHGVAAAVANGDKVDEADIESYIEQHEENENYCKQTVKDSWYDMAVTLVNEYTIPNKSRILAVEKQVFFELVDGVFPAGTLDLLEGTKEDAILTDYKSYNSKTKPKTMPAEYKYQLLVYVWILRKLGYFVTRIRLVYISRNIDGGISEKTNKPLKSYPPEVTVLTETVADEDLAFIESQLSLCADKIAVTKKQPDIAHVIWHDPRLKVVND